MKKAAKVTHGGHRERSGRPAPHGRKRPLTLQLTPSVLQYIERMAKSCNESKSQFVDRVFRHEDAFKKMFPDEKPHD